MVNVGERAPTPNLKSTTKDHVNQDISLKEVYKQGTTILYFFPAAFTGVCSKSSCELRDTIMEFEDLGASIFSISTDLPFTHKKFIDEYDINYPVLSDWNKEAITAFDVNDSNFAGYFQGVPKRSLFVVRDGKITYKWIGEHPGVYPPFDELKASIKD